MDQGPIRLEMRGIHKSYGGTRALDGVDFSAVGGEVHAVAGENGAGKTTLMKILTGAVQADEGSIALSGEVCRVDSPARAHRLGIRSVHQHFSLVPHLSVAENVLLGALPSTRLRWCINWKDAYQTTRRILESIGLQDINPRQTVARLSVAQQQMVEIAKALVRKPRILILDEPSAVLTQRELDQLFRLIRQLREESVLILYISHRLDELYEIVDRVTVLKDGRLVGTVPMEQTDRQSLVRMMIGRTLEDMFPQREKPSTVPVLQVEGLSRADVFSDVNLTVHKGEIVGMYGLVGSGRTEVARCIYGADRTTTGTVRVNDRLVNPPSPSAALKSGIALLTEDRTRDGLVLFLSTLLNAGMASSKNLTRLGVVNVRKQRENVTDMVRALNVRPPRLGLSVASLSGGNQQKVVFAKWLLVHAPVLILDEPTRGVDVGTKNEIYGIIRRLAEQGVAIVLISSEMPEVLGLSDRILVMREGRIVDECAKAEASEERLLSSAAGVANGNGGARHGA